MDINKNTFQIKLSCFLWSVSYKEIYYGSEGLMKVFHFFLVMCICVCFPVWRCAVCAMCVRCLRKLEPGVRSLGTGVRLGVRGLIWLLGWKSCLLQGQQVLLDADFSLWSCYLYLLCKIQNRMNVSKISSEALYQEFYYLAFSLGNYYMDSILLKNI